MVIGLISEIKRAILGKRLVVVCGAGVARASCPTAALGGWGQLVTHAIEWCDDNGVIGTGRQWKDRVIGDVGAGDLISAADKLHRALEESGEWTRFLRETFQNTRAIDPSLILAIADLGCPIITTNYDTLIEQVTHLPPISWHSELFESALNEGGVGIAHIHGVWSEPDSVVFGNLSYGRVTGDAHTVSARNAMGVRASMLFVGVGDGLVDPDFGQLYDLLRREYRNRGMTHTRLRTDSDSVLPLEPPFRDLVYGPKHSDLVPFIRTRLSESAPAVAAKYSTRDELLAQPLILGQAMGPTLGQIWPTLMIAPRLRSVRAIGAETLEFSEWLAKMTTAKKSVAIIGDPGVGKTTVLRQVVLDGYQIAGREPVYIAANDLVASPGILPQDKACLIDGLDELGEDGQATLAGILRASRSSPWWLSCRLDYFSRRSPLSDVLASCEEVAVVQPIDASVAKQFLQGIRQSFPGATNAVSKVESWLEIDGFESLAATPLALTLALSIALDEAARPDRAPTSRFDLFQQFYSGWVAREIVQFGLTPRQRNGIRQRHRALAAKMYQNRQSGKPNRVRVRLTGNKTDTAVLSLVRSDQDIGYVVGREFVHETLLEFLLADYLLAEFRRSTPSSSVSTIAANDDVHQLVRDAFSALSAIDRRRIELNLAAAFRTCDHERVQEHILYYLGRLGAERCPTVLIDAYYSKASSRLIRRSGALGAMLYGVGEVEAHYMGVLEGDPEEAALNRAVQLVYFGDEVGDLHAARDGGGDWTRTRRTLVRRLSEATTRAQRLRWWDLFTLGDFCRDRMYTLEGAEIAVVERSADLEADPQRRRALESLRDALLSKG